MSTYCQRDTRPHPCINRFREADEEEPPWAGIQFVHEVGSDELSELLKARYPSLLKHRQRKFMAVYDFFRSELLRLGLSSSEYSAVSEDAEDSRMNNPPSDADMFRDPLQSTSGRQTAASYNSPMVPSSNESPQLTERARSSVAQPLSPGLGVSSSGPSTYVFSLVDGRQHLQRTKKKMSIKEREDYKKIRERGACSKCKRLKAKCTHDTESLSPQQQPSELKRPAKRGASPTHDGIGSQSTKVPKTGEGSIRTRTPDVHQQQHSEIDVVDTINVTTEGQWDNSGYVLSQPEPTQLNPVPISSSSNPHWPSYVGIPLEPLPPVFQDNVPQLPRSPYPSTPQDLSFNYTYHVTYTPDTNWDNGQDPQLGEPDPP